MSSVPGAHAHIKQVFTPKHSGKEKAVIETLIKALNLQPHIEGGFFTETDRAPALVPSPFPVKKSNTSELAPQRPGFNAAVRNASTTIFYLLTECGPQGGFHRNAARTMHTLHRGRGQYVIIHDNEETSNGKKRIETFIVGQDVANGERLQWMVEGGKYKASFLLPDAEHGQSSDGLLISEVVVPGFEFCDHDFLSREGLKAIVTETQLQELEWLLRSGE